MRSGKILVMDDEDSVRQIALLMLQRIGYETAGARDGAEVLELYREAKSSGAPFDMVIMDLTVPGGMGGKETMEKLRRIDPAVKAIVSSGYANDPIMAEFRKYGFINVLAKPYRVDDLNRAMAVLQQKEP